MDDRLQAYLSKRNTYLIVCPHCRASREFLADQIPPRMSNPFTYVCSCGETLRVRLVAHRGYRKPVNLTGSFTLHSPSRKLQMLCTVHDISLKGMRVTTDLVKHIVKDEMIKASIVLDDEPHTRLEMPARIRRVTPEQNRLSLGVEFLPTARQEDVLGSYVSS
jgi:PilZ domain